MIDKMMNWLWLFVFVTMLIAVVEKLSCVRFYHIYGNCFLSRLHSTAAGKDGTVQSNTPEWRKCVGRLRKGR